MIPTIQKVIEALKEYHLYWDSSLKGDLDIFNTTLDDTYELIVTSESEIGHTKVEGIKFAEARIQEIGGKLDVKQKKEKEQYSSTRYQ